MYFCPKFIFDENDDLFVLCNVTIDYFLCFSFMFLTIVWNNFCLLFPVVVVCTIMGSLSLIVSLCVLIMFVNMSQVNILLGFSGNSYVYLEYIDVSFLCRQLFSSFLFKFSEFAMAHLTPNSLVLIFVCLMVMGFNSNGISVSSLVCNSFCIFLFCVYVSVLLIHPMVQFCVVLNVVFVNVDFVFF